MGKLISEVEKLREWWIVDVPVVGNVPIILALGSYMDAISWPVLAKKLLDPELTGELMVTSNYCWFRWCPGYISPRELWGWFIYYWKITFLLSYLFGNPPLDYPAKKPLRALLIE